MVLVNSITCPTTWIFPLYSCFSRITGIFKSRPLTMISLLFASSLLILELDNLRKISYLKTRLSPVVNSKKIVMWVSPQTDDPKFRRDLIRTMIVKPQNRDNTCFHQHRCEMNMDEGMIQEADAIVFFMFNWNLKLEDLPPSWQTWRKQNQIWIIHADESPINVVNNDLVPPVFNWSITYRRDSDVWWTYGRKEPLIPEIPTNQELQINGNNPLSAWISGKSKLVAAVISHCSTDSKRESMIKLIQNTGKQADVYGTCGDLSVKCDFYSEDCTGFWNNLSKTYKFYLAFENSLCVDYITEKFWRSLELGMVPVVYGGANYTQLAPPGSFVDVNQFESADSLMSFLEEVGGNARLYATYFDWRRSNKLVDTGKSYFAGNNKAWCELCQKLHTFKNGNKNADEIPSAQVPSDWWIKMPNNPTARVCISPSEFTLGKWESFEKQKQRSNKGNSTPDLTAYSQTSNVTFVNYN